MANRIGANEAWAAGPVEPKNTAKQVIFIFLEGAPSGVDTFGFKEIPGVTPADFNPDTINGIQIPTGLFPNTAQVLDKVAIIRSGLSWALAHNLAQTWFQIGRNPTSPLGAIAPHIGSVVAIEKDPERRPDQLFPTFIALNAGNAPGSGYFPIEYGPFKTIPDANGLASTMHKGGQVRFDKRWDLLQTLDAPLRGADSPLGSAVAGMSDFYQSARGLMFNPVVDAAFSFTTEESLAYGDTNFGDACLMAKKIVAADQGTRFLQITQRGWDHHQGIYDRNEINGRQVGPVTNGRAGRDHYLQMFYLFAGGGVQGGNVIGATDPTGAFTTDPGWSRQRSVRPEDIEATIYSALGIDWTTIRNDDPLGRGFEYVPEAAEDIYGPVDELWG